ncbi:hypothetical protein [Pseudonocardia sp. EC080625-04]|uniref:hypothetical protein n=1 Tax=Pseudonocardia sp. EC080625-04 TaxID=1096868 RepID=UPI000761456A|nr:hypothetical protein [Pseudonocardia sp. EC080625-04]
MNLSTQTGPAPASDLGRPSPPTRDESIRQILTPTRRTIVPIRRGFVQLGHGKTTRPGPLAEFVTGHDERGLDAYLLVHGIASAAEPHTAVMHAGAWARILGLGEAATPTSAKSAVSKVMRRLEQRKLVTRSRRNRTSVVTLLREDGSGEDFKRPEGRTRDDRWLQFPHSYWTDGTYLDLELPGKALLLIALSLPAGFPLPEQKAAGWYGISSSTIGAGIRELLQAEILHRDQKWVETTKSEHGWTQDYRYTLVGDYSIEARKRAAKSRYGDPETADTDIASDVEDALDELAGENP